MKTVTILIPIYNESGNVGRLIDELEKTAEQLAGYTFDYLFVDDGSKDNTVDILRKRQKIDTHIRVIELSRNFGKEIALSAGIDHLETDAVIIMDADLQHPPSYIPQFLKKWEEGFEIVSTKRVAIQNQPLLRTLGSFFFYQILNLISEFKMEPQTTDFRLLDRTVVEALKSFREKNRMVRGIIDWMGFKKTHIEFEAPERNAGQAGYSYAKLFKLAMNSMTSFSLFPLKVAGYMGVLITAVFGLLLACMVVDKLTINCMNFSSISFVIVINSLLSGLVLSCLGLVALYIGNIHTEVVNRPLYIIRKHHSSRDGGDGQAGNKAG